MADFDKAIPAAARGAAEAVRDPTVADRIELVLRYHLAPVWQAQQEQERRLRAAASLALTLLEHTTAYGYAADRLRAALREEVKDG